MRAPLPKISIITANLNGGATLERTITSVVGQGYPHLEYVVVDGGSTDNSQQLIGHYRQGIDTLIVEPDEGISDAFNKGIRAATGDIIGIISSDDYLEAGALEQIAAFYVEHSGPDVIYGNAGFIERGRRVVVRPDPLGKVWKRQPLKHSSVFVSKGAYERYGLFDPEWRYAMDYDLALRFYLRGARFAYLDSTLTTFSGGGVNQAFLQNTIREVRDIAVRAGLTRSRAQFYLAQKIIKLHARRLLLGLGMGIFLKAYRRLSCRYQGPPTDASSS